ncbi:U3 small nucleolar RNA-associated protein 25 [Venturia nashicola]|uniref:U3 small nucleolar RNA-associated protein 25 n=1 Tax=Venturia nashicola TaxID=86259 RepID=A0A4Z1P270_9PEZI|nr:U3 small nucleolar RNA-associated protein 25 [Venturia nashicola]TLD22546.1 U3 small nucleolar RNA-associated protein 25 [Venturia nashicola]
MASQPNNRGYSPSGVHNTYQPPAYVRNERYDPVQPTKGTSSHQPGLKMNNSPSGPNFDVLDWHPHYVSCQRYFLDHAQHDPATRSACALLNILLPCQWPSNPVMSSSGCPPQPHAQGAYSALYSRHPDAGDRAGPRPAVSLVPFIRRMVVTGFDKDGVLHGFFGDAWRKGVGPLQECERRNYLFAAKSAGWAKVKYQYDMSDNQTVPFIKPLQNVQLQEIEAAEKEWSNWLAMEDWMVGPRAPDLQEDASRD